MFAEVAAAAMVGVTFSNSWVCLLLSLGTRTHSKKMAGAFIIGRFLGIMALGTIVALFGLIVDIPTKYYTLVFGIITILFAIYIFARHILPKMSIVQRFTILKKLRILGCSDCSHHLHKEASDSVHKDCDPSANPGGCEGCPNQHHHSPKKSSEVTGKSGFVYGALRGATPCLKMLILAPLLITVTFPMALLLTGVFAVASSIYPLIGFLVGGLITQLASVTRSPRTAVVLNLISLSLLLGIGIYYVYKFFTSDCALEGA